MAGSFSTIKKIRWLLVLGFIIVLVQMIAWGAAEALVVRSDLGDAEALVVLGGSSTYLERTHYAAKLFNQRRASSILLTNDNLPSGWSAEKNRNPLFVERAADELRDLGVPTEKIEIVPGGVTSTYDEAIRIRDYANQHRLHSILVVTSAYQSRRALWTLRRVFGDASVHISLEPVPPGWQSPRPAIWWSNRLGWKMVPGEYLKMAYYWMRY